MMRLTQARDTLLRLALDLGDSPPGRLCAIFTYARKMSLVPLEPRKVAASALFRALYAQRCFEGHHHEAASMAKKIIILADGSGNAFTRQESNIWRLYDALDLTQADHLAHYVQGVGTSSFRPWATIDAATGLGVPENVRRAYEYLCRNWSPDDQIYMFGFSRGAFTVRTLIGMIHHEGLLPTEREDGLVPLPELREDIRAAWRSYRAKTAPFRIREMSPIIAVVRAIRDIVMGAWRFMRLRPLYSTLADDHPRRRPEIGFVGLFDTVEAYGVPIEEFRRAINWGIWPISFRNNRISPLVRKACHALALDDERLTFHPLRIELPEGDPPPRSGWRKFGFQAFILMWAAAIPRPALRTYHWSG